MEQEKFGCCFPDRCLMPGFHFKSECHTVDMLERQHGPDYDLALSLNELIAINEKLRDGKITYQEWLEMAFPFTEAA